MSAGPAKASDIVPNGWLRLGAVVANDGTPSQTIDLTSAQGNPHTLIVQCDSVFITGPGVLNADADIVWAANVPVYIPVAGHSIWNVGQAVGGDTCNFRLTLLYTRDSPV